MQKTVTTIRKPVKANFLCTAFLFHIFTVIILRADKIVKEMRQTGAPPAHPPRTAHVFAANPLTAATAWFIIDDVIVCNVNLLHFVAFGGK